jgi:hypothetical protein
MSFFAAGTLFGDSRVLGQFVSARNLTILEGFSGSQAYLDVAPSADVSLSVMVNGSLVGTIEFATGDNVGVLTGASGSFLSVGVGDRVQILGPASEDVSAATLSVTIKASLA